MQTAIEFRDFAQNSLFLDTKSINLETLAGCSPLTKLQRFIVSNTLQKQYYSLLQKKLNLHQLKRQSVQLHKNANNQQLEEQYHESLRQIKTGTIIQHETGEYKKLNERKPQNIYNIFEDQQKLSTLVFYRNLNDKLQEWILQLNQKAQLIDEKTQDLKYTIQRSVNPVSLKQINITGKNQNNFVSVPDFSPEYREISQIIIENEKLNEELTIGYRMQFKYQNEENNNFYELFNASIDNIQNLQESEVYMALHKHIMAFEYINDQIQQQISILQEQENSSQLNELQEEIQSNTNIYNNQLVLIKECYEMYSKSKNTAKSLSELFTNNNLILQLNNNCIQLRLKFKEIVDQMNSYLKNKYVDFKFLTGRGYDYTFTNPQEYVSFCKNFFRQYQTWSSILGSPSLEQGIYQYNNQVFEMIKAIEKHENQYEAQMLKNILQIEAATDSEQDLVHQPAVIEKEFQQPTIHTQSHAQLYTELKERYDKIMNNNKQQNHQAGVQ